MENVYVGEGNLPKPEEHKYFGRGDLPKPKENQYFGQETFQNLSKTNIFEEKPSKT